MVMKGEGNMTETLNGTRSDLERESESITDPILPNPVLLGPLYVGTGTVLADPYTKWSATSSGSGSKSRRWRSCATSGAPT